MLCKMTYSHRIKPKIIVICGPTALGKTSISIDLAKIFYGEVINADSMQIYRYMDIGTAKPTPEEQAAVAHHMVDIINPDEPFDARQYALMAQEKIKQLHIKGVIPLIVGGTGLYIKALVHGLFNLGPLDAYVRDKLIQKANVQGSNFLHKQLMGCDPYAAQRIHPNDTYRIIRALEIYETTGKPISKLHREHKFSDTPYNVLKIGLIMARDLLYDRINKRVDVMIEAGFVDEVKWLIKEGYSTDLKSMRSIGYRHMVDFIQGNSSWSEALGIFKRDTRRYAKRQLTWFKADAEILWTAPGRVDDLRPVIKKFLHEA